MAAVTRERGYCNTDLCLKSESDLTPLADALTVRGLPSMCVQLCEDGNWYASFETEEDFDEPLANIAAILDILDSLPEPHLTTWANCTRRELDIGFDSPAMRPELDLTFPCDLLARVVGVKATLRVTVYPSHSADSIQTANDDSQCPPA